ncbi:tyrosine recombinase XerS [Ammoniphilus resinae]|uniref:Site-specific recombinase XerD n=1 Tax=Ammoniphilus resinae TaxID=861532 RepID=A0ABS4GM48_9BACL|nr:tyrosine recombinase XerS [Ammoniphilus resinae]MBP1931147.1 site-specific recombinase XerD [Ammoniphilus resinae]
MAREFREQITERLESKLDSLPWYVMEFIHHKQLKMSPASLLNYVHDYIIFFDWLVIEGFHPGPREKISLEVLAKLKLQDIDNFQRFLMLNRKKSGSSKSISSATINRKLSSLKSLFHYLSQIAEDDQFNPYLRRNVMAKVEMTGEKMTPAAKAKKIEGKILRGEEMNQFLQFVSLDYPKAVAENKKLVSFHEKNKERDVAMISLILGSGMRVSEIVGLDLEDIDQSSCTARVMRKGNKEDSVPFDNVALQDLLSYIAVRKEKYKVDKSEKALFLSYPIGPVGVSNRMTTRAVQQIIKKYAKAFGKPLLSVHKLRHSFATEHFERNQNLPILSEILGHESIETTGVYNHLSQTAKRESVNRLNR